MLLSNRDASNLIRKMLTKIFFDNEETQKMIFELHDKFDVPMGDVSDYITGRKKFEDASPFMLFMIAYGFDHHIKNCNIVKEIFTDIEIKEFSKAKCPVEKIEFPIRIKCIQVAPDQWIGSCSAKFLMLLRDAQMINYNTNAQRTMRRVVKNGNEFFKISVNKGAVKSIKDSLKSEIFIPNTITLNIPSEGSEFRYNENSAELVINKLNYFDIADGYHRYLAISQLYTEDSSFDYPLELRIVCFSDDKTKQFIFQEDQKTKMKKLDSNSMNMSSPSNAVAERLNRNVMFDWSGQISRNEGKINLPEFAAMIDYFYYKVANPNRAKYKDNQFIINTEAELIKRLNPVIESDARLLEGKVTFKMLLILFYCITTYNAGEDIDYIKKGLDNVDKLTLKSREVKKSSVNAVRELLG